MQCVSCKRLISFWVERCAAATLVFTAKLVVALMDLDRGAVIEVVDSPIREGESPLFEQGLMGHVQVGDILLADRTYFGYHSRPLKSPK